MDKKRRVQRRGSWALAACALAISASALALPPNAAMLTNACASCHGMFGASAGASMPSLAGHSKQSIVEAMKKFKSGERPSTVMGRLAKGYSDADCAAMGGYFAAQKLHITTQTLDPQRVSKGASLHNANCKACHPDNGKTNENDAPPMASQWLPYLRAEMALYVEGKRKTTMMSDVVKALSADDLESLLQFYASVK